MSCTTYNSTDSWQYELYSSDKVPAGGFKSIKEAIESAIEDETDEPELDWYMSMTDSIVDIIMSADPDKDSTKEGLTDV